MPEPGDGLYVISFLPGDKLSGETSFFGFGASPPESLFLDPPKVVRSLGFCCKGSKAPLRIEIICRDCEIDWFWFWRVSSNETNGIGFKTQTYIKQIIMSKRIYDFNIK